MQGQNHGPKKPESDKANPEPDGPADFGCEPSEYNKREEDNGMCKGQVAQSPIGAGRG